MARNSLKNVMRLIDAANNAAPVESLFLMDLKRCIELTEMQNSRPPSKTYKPSSMKCIRNMFYQVTGADQDDTIPSYTLVGICNSGTDIHARVQSYMTQMKSCGIDCEYVDVGEFVKMRGLSDIEVVSKSGWETKLYHKKYNMSFLTDGIIRYQGRYYIVEIKTETSYKWGTRKGVDPVHMDQATAYSIAFGIDDVLFLYITRDTVDIKTFMFHVDSDRKQALVGKIDTCNGYVESQMIPPMPSDVDRKTCEYCSYKGRCRKDG